MAGKNHFHLGFIVVLLFFLFIALIQINKSQNLNKKASNNELPQKNKQILLISLATDAKGKPIKLINIKAQYGFVPKNKNTGNKTVQIIKDGKVLYETDYNSTTLIDVPLAKNLTDKNLPPKADNNSNFTLPYIEGGNIVISDKQSKSAVFTLESKTVESFSPKTSLYSDWKNMTIPKSPVYLNGQKISSTMTTTDQDEGDGNFDVVYIASNYLDFNQFHVDAQAMQQKLLATAPFSEFSAKTNIWLVDNTADLGCHYDQVITRLIVCDIYSVLEAASRYPYDTIIVINNSLTYGGAGYLGAKIATTYRDINDAAKEVAVHETGHAFGNLWDEYEYGYPPYEGNPGSVNCSPLPCRWGTPCFTGCSYSNLGRLTNYDCIMSALHPETGFHFCRICENELRTILDQVTTIIPTQTLTPTVTENPTPTLTPTPNQSPTPTTTTYPRSTPTPTPIQTPTPTITIALSPTPTLILTATPTLTRGICDLKISGDADCNYLIELPDFFIWRREFFEYMIDQQPRPNYYQSDFNSDGKVELSDFFIWRSGFLNR